MLKYCESVASESEGAPDVAQMRAADRNFNLWRARDEDECCIFVALKTERVAKIE